MIGNHSPATRSKIGASKRATAWRRQQRDKGGDMQSSIGQWEEDFSTPARRHVRSRGLWEECHNSMVYDR